MARFYVLLSGVITQSLAEDEIRKFLAPHKINFVRTEWFSTFEGNDNHKLFKVTF